MRLTVHTDYALRMLMLLATEPDHLHTIEDISARYGISRNHLMKVALTLVAAGFVRSTRGRNGGLELQRPPDDISLGKVVRATEDNFTLVECFDAHHNQCAITPVCGLIEPLQRAMQAFLEVLDQYSLADLIGSGARQRRMLNLLAASHDSRR